VTAVMRIWLFGYRKYRKKMGIKRNKNGKAISYLYVMFFLFFNSSDSYFELIPAC
jgi:hypothetical protein